MSPLLGTVTTTATRYELRADRTWRVVAVTGFRRDEEAAPFERALGQIYGASWYGPALGRPGAAALEDLASKVSGTVWMPPAPPADPNVAS